MVKRPPNSLPDNRNGDGAVRRKNQRLEKRYSSTGETILFRAQLDPRKCFPTLHTYCGTSPAWVFSGLGAGAEKLNPTPRPPPASHSVPVHWFAAPSRCTRR